MFLDRQGVRILGTSAEGIDMAEDREKFSRMCDSLGIDQPRWKELSSMEDIYAFADEVGLPVSKNGLILPCGAAGRWEAGK